jgi:SAM-dependent methyltransferase
MDMEIKQGTRGAAVSSDSQTSLDQSRLNTVASCPICGGNPKRLRILRTINPISKDTVALMECLTCRHWWHDPMPTQEYLSKMYAQNSEFVVNLSVLQHFINPDPGATERFAERILGDLGNRVEYNYLEIGCGPGHLVEYFFGKAKHSYGVEPARNAQTRNVVPSLDDVPPGLFFDCVVMQDVLEHVADPVNLLKHVRARVNDNAVLYAGFPNKDCWKAKIQKEKWGPISPVGHLHYFSSDSVDFMFALSDWGVINKRTVRPGALSARDIISQFDYKSPGLPYRLLKGLLVGQLLLGRDQWLVVAQPRN